MKATVDYAFRFHIKIEIIKSFFNYKRFIKYLFKKTWNIHYFLAISQLDNLTNTALFIISLPVVLELILITLTKAKQP